MKEQDPHYPLVDIDFIDNLIAKSPKVIPNSKIKNGNSIVFYLIGTQALYKRTISIRNLNNKGVGFESATGLAIRLGFMTQLLLWYESNKKWKDGGFYE